LEKAYVLQTDEVDPQWRQVMRILGVDVIPMPSLLRLKARSRGLTIGYRTGSSEPCAIEKLATIEEARPVLKEEVNRYNDYQVHSTTKEILGIRFERARKEGNTLFRPFTLPKPYTSSKDIFCLREKQMVNGYRKISLFNHEIPVPNVPLREEVEVHLVPDIKREAMEIRIWWGSHIVQSVAYPLKEFPGVHF